MLGTLAIALCRGPARMAAERVVGKLGHAHCFRPCLRASLSRSFGWLREARDAGLPRVAMEMDVLNEL
eukprot:8703757-Lingulodinium_polyedra.AAC.1